MVCAAAMIWVFLKALPQEVVELRGPFMRSIQCWWFGFLYFDNNTHWIHVVIWRFNLCHFNQRYSQ